MKKWKCLTLIVVQLFISVMLCSNRVYGQEKVLSVNFKNATLLSVLEYLSNQTECVILYNHEQVKGTSGISVELKDKTMSEVLDKCLEKTKFTFKLVFQRSMYSSSG